MLWYCVDNSSYQGCSLPERVELYDDEDTGENPCLTEDNAEWGQDSSNNAEWGQDPSNNAEWGQDSSNNVEWGQDSSQMGLPKPVYDEAEWSDGWRSN